MKNSATSTIRHRASRWRTAGVVTAATGVLTLVGCLGLQVDNPNTLDLAAVYSNASNTEAALIGGWKRYYGMVVGQGTNNGNANCPGVPFGAWGNVITNVPSTTYLEAPSEPRLPIDNINSLQCVTRGPWYDAYSAMASGRESYNAILANGLKYGTVNATTPNGSGTPMRLIFAKFIQALGQSTLALRFDQAFIPELTTQPDDALNGKLTLKPYKEVQASTIAKFREIIADAKATADFTFPLVWINQRDITRDELVRICLTYITRLEVYTPRTPTERDAVNWAAVLARLDSGITRDFAEQADPAVALTSSPWINLSFSSTTIRISNRLLGPADTSGKYQAWLATPIATRNSITITTPDRRIHGAAGPTTVGTRFTYLTTNMSNASLAPWLTSKYRSNRFLTSTSDSGSKGLNVLASLEEVKFMRAEALYRLGRGTEAAALINPTRLAAGLKAVTASGPPAGKDCVPKKDDGSCGDLFDAIQYEKRIEMYPGSEADLFWYDARGWGKMISGTPYHIPVSGRELATLKIPYYTFGGTGSPGTQP